MEKPMFYQGQRIVCIQRFRCFSGGDKKNPLIEGKTYIVSNPDSKHPLSKSITVNLVGLPQSQHFRQLQFIPYDTDKELENEIHEALKGVKIEKL